jgi:FkbM family methyltransferase
MALVLDPVHEQVRLAINTVILAIKRPFPCRFALRPKTLSPKPATKRKDSFATIAGKICLAYLWPKTAMTSSQGPSPKLDNVFYSRHDIDKIIFKYFINQECRDGRFVELGAYDGVHCSNTKFFEDNLGFCGILIEPSPKKFELLKKNRSARNSFFNGAVTDIDRGKVEFIGHTPVSGMVHSMRKEFKDTWHSKNEPYEVPTLRMSEILEEAKFSYIDFFSLDVEGAEYEVLKTMNWKVPVYLLIVEMNKGDEIKNKLTNELVLEAGMVFERQIGNNFLYINKSYPRAQRLYKSIQGLH